MTRTDRRTVAAVFEAHRSVVESVALREMGNADDAADVVQEVALRMCRARGEIREPGAWLVRVTRNEAIRMRGRRRVGVVSIEECARELVSVGDDVDAGLVRRDMSLMSARALEALPAPDRAIIERCFDDRATVAAVARRLGVHRRTVERARKRSLERMRATLKNHKKI